MFAIMEFSEKSFIVCIFFRRIRLMLLTRHKTQINWFISCKTLILATCLGFNENSGLLTKKPQISHRWNVAFRSHKCVIIYQVRHFVRFSRIKRYLKKEAIINDSDDKNDLDDAWFILQRNSNIPITRAILSNFLLLWDMERLNEQWVGLTDSRKTWNKL